MSSGSKSFIIHKIDDRRAIDVFEKISARFNEQTPISVRVAPSVQFNLSKYLPAKPKNGTYDVPFISWSGTSKSNGQYISLEFSRSLENDHAKTSPSFDRFTVTFGGDLHVWSQYPDEVAATIRIISETDLPVKPAPEQNDTALLRTLIQGFAATHNQLLDDVKTSLLEISGHRASLEREAHERQREREEAHASALEALNEERAKLLLQSHQHERRKITKELYDIASNGSQNGVRSSGGRVIGHAVFLIGIVAAFLSGYLSFITIQDVSGRAAQFNDVVALLKSKSTLATPELQAAFDAQFGQLTWFIAAKSLLSGAFSIFAFWFSVNWIRKYYDDDRNNQIAMQRLKSDVARATWIIEAIQEVKHEAKADLPHEWIQSVTKNLFSTQSEEKEVSDGAMALRALLGFTANASFGPEGPKFELNKRGAKNLSRSDE